MGFASQKILENELWDLSVMSVFILLRKTVISRSLSPYFDSYILVHRQKDLEVGSDWDIIIILEFIYLIIKRDPDFRKYYSFCILNEINFKNHPYFPTFTSSSSFINFQTWLKYMGSIIYFINILHSFIIGERIRFQTFIWFWMNFLCHFLGCLTILPLR